MTAPARLEVLLEEPERTVIQVVLYEGRNRQSAVCARRSAGGRPPAPYGGRQGAAGRPGAGKWRELEPHEVRDLLLASREKVAAALSSGKAGEFRGNLTFRPVKRKNDWCRQHGAAGGLSSTDRGVRRPAGRLCAVCARRRPGDTALGRGGRPGTAGGRWCARR